MTSAALRDYRVRTMILPLALIAYALIAIYVKPSTRAELFPFFNWSLFSESKTPTSLVVVEIRSIEGRELSEPTQYYALGDKFAQAANRNSRMMKATTRLGYALKGGDPTMIPDLRDILESYYMREASQVEYDIVELTYDPIERYRNGTVIKRETLGSFVK